MSNLKKLFALVVVIVFSIITLMVVGRSFVSVNADEIVVVQHPVDGDLVWHITPGMKWRQFGSATTYMKSSHYWFSRFEDQGTSKDQSIRIRFNDGGHAQISGSIRWEMPQDEEALNRIHAKYGSMRAVEQELVRPVVEKAVYMTGPLMSSKESYSEKRNALINYIEDQIVNGVYRTTANDIKTKDPMTGEEKTVTITEIVTGADGKPLRQEGSPIEEFGIRVYNLSINEITYDKKVEEQIAQQQKALMDVQTAIANAKKAEQNAITAEQEGHAKAAQAKWEQEAIKAKAVVMAEQVKEVAKLEKEAAEFEKQKQILLGEGEAERKRLVMNADGALAQKLDTWLTAQKYWAEAFAKRPVPSVVMSGAADAGSRPDNGAREFMNLMTIQAAKDLSLDMGVKAR